MDHNSPDIIWMRFKGGNLFGRVVIIHPDVEIIGTANDPILAGDESSGSNRNISEFESLYDCLFVL